MASQRAVAAPDATQAPNPLSRPPSAPLLRAHAAAQRAVVAGAIGPSPATTGYFTRAAGTWRCTGVGQVLHLALTAGNEEAQIEAALASLPQQTTSSHATLHAAPDGTLLLEVRAFAPGSE